MGLGLGLGLGFGAYRPAPRTVGGKPRDEDRVRAVEARAALEPAQPDRRTWLGLGLGSG